MESITKRSPNRFHTERIRRNGTIDDDEECTIKRMEKNQFYIYL